MYSKMINGIFNLTAICIGKTVSPAIQCQYILPKRLESTSGYILTETGSTVILKISQSNLILKFANSNSMSVLYCLL